VGCHEVGYPEALGKPVVQICATPVAVLPFNLRNNKTIVYQVNLRPETDGVAAAVMAPQCMALTIHLGHHIWSFT
jgi:hypothetical protein